MLELLLPAIRDNSLPPRDRLGLQSDLFALVNISNFCIFRIPYLLDSMKSRGAACKTFSVSDVRRNPNCDQITCFLISSNTQSGAYLKFRPKGWLLIGRRTHNRGKSLDQLNPGQVGFYRVQYSSAMLELLLPAIRDNSLPPRDRLGLQSDLFALVNISNFCIFRIPYLLDSMKSRGAACKTFSVSDVRRNPNCDQITCFLISSNTQSGAYLKFRPKGWLLIGRRTHNRGKSLIKFSCC